MTLRVAKLERAQLNVGVEYVYREGGRPRLVVEAGQPDWGVFAEHISFILCTSVMNTLCCTKASNFSLSLRQYLSRYRMTGNRCRIACALCRACRQVDDMEDHIIA